MDTLLRLNNLVGKQGLLKTQLGEPRFTFLSVNAVPPLPCEDSEEAFQKAIGRSSFEVRFDEGVLIDGNVKMVVSGFDISRIF